MHIIIITAIEENLQGFTSPIVPGVHYGQETSGERSNDVLEGIFEITALFRNNLSMKTC